VIGESTYEGLGDGARVEPLGDLQLKGKADPVAAYVLISLG
jgi:class 3 adenylate cyclase